MAWKVKYVAGGSCDLFHPLTDGRNNFVAGIEYEITEYSDFVRLTTGGDFVEVKEVVVKPMPVPTPTPVAVETPKLGEQE